MQISQNLKLKQSQSLVMTPQLQQAIKLLQLNNLELSNLVNKELEENPFLENESVELDDNENTEYEETNDLKDSFENGESISDEPKNEEVKKTISKQNSTQKTIKIQFGAFSKINNAEKQKDLISKQISAKYPEFSDNLKILSENKLFKLIYISKNREIADSICKFSKSKKINCLILKK